MVNFAIREPSRPSNIPEHAQWLAGIDSGFWFAIDPHDEVKYIYTIYCYEMTGDLKFKRLYVVDHPGFNWKVNYAFTHLSHGQYCSISQNNKLYRFSLLSKDNKDQSKSDHSEIGNN